MRRRAFIAALPVAGALFVVLACSSDDPALVLVPSSASDAGSDITVSDTKSDHEYLPIEGYQPFIGAAPPARTKLVRALCCRHGPRADVREVNGGQRDSRRMSSAIRRRLSS